MVTTVDEEVVVWQGKVRTTVRVAGDGPPLVFFHDGTGLQWDHLLDSLAATHRVYAPMHPGTDGKHPDDVRALRHLSDLIVCYAELFDTIGLDHAVLVGHAFGGMIAAEIAATYPRFADRLVLLAPFGLWRDEEPFPNWMTLDPQALLAATFADPGGPLAAAAIEQMGALAADPEQAARRFWTIACTGEFVWPIPDRGLGNRIHRISAPTLVVWGRQDGIIPAGYADDFGRRIADARVEVIDGAGHLPQLEQPEIVTKLVHDFLCS
jgi:pimeloyl-ACP methyl ester carboxylesterase